MGTCIYYNFKVMIQFRVRSIVTFMYWKTILHIRRYTETINHVCHFLFLTNKSRIANCLRVIRPMEIGS